MSQELSQLTANCQAADVHCHEMDAKRDSLR